ncbi:MAG TPA: uridine kinase [Bacteroidota bacterium]|nr:uridine kinase [Bacteroidota bacterium]
MKKLVIGIAGGTGSGKTSVTQKILEQLNAHESHESVVVIQHDSYYKDISEYGGLTGDKINFDHPDSLETGLLVEHISRLIAGKTIEQPMYNFTTHSRMAETRRIEPKTITIIEGILIYTSKALRDLMDIKIFIDTDADERLLRRLKRDLIERGRSIESVMNQYINTVKPMHLEFVEPSKTYADIIIPRGSENAVAIDMVAVKIEQMLDEQEKAAIPKPRLAAVR